MTVSQRYARLRDLPLESVAGRRRGVFGGWKSLVEIFRHREMLGLLVRRDIKARYKDSALGFVWTLIRPLTQLAIFWLVIGQFLGAERGIPDFAIYVFAGLTAYGLFSEIVSSGTASVVGNAGLIKKVYLPREVFPIASVGSALFNFSIQFAILVLATIVLGVFPTFPDILYLLPSLAVLLLFGTALGILMSAVNVYLRDMQYLIEVVLLIALWASPILYAWEMARDFLGEGLLLEIYTNNPVTLAALGFQQAMWNSGDGVVDYPADLLERLGIAALVGLVAVILAQRVFARLESNFAQEL
ncbi:ABC-2 type transport system permease protein [Microcella putealis]|uniref:Transport permease protein n=1 Tax=Microcella putealis TaxID=337005 RepID=A0A4Q7LSU3_9MICO|nr:ABC transporter permease [Microcella putealis]RZS57402.1 ABC-2 type transport system permease protein [Microcella putealis]TQM19455.1 ABC-2 type transport system permease protein [Microcella putealis]